MRRITATAAMILLALAPVASARRPATLAPPGNSGVSQYLETVPTDSGSKPTTATGSPGGTLTSQQQQHLDSLGASGRTLAAVVSATGPAPATPAKRTAGSGRGDAGSRSGPAGGPRPRPGLHLSGGSRSPVSSLVAALGGDGGGGLGWFLPVLIGISTLAVLVRAVVRTGRGPQT